MIGVYPGPPSARWSRSEQGKQGLIPRAFLWGFVEETARLTTQPPSPASPPTPSPTPAPACPPWGGGAARGHSPTRRKPSGGQGRTLEQGLPFGTCRPDILPHGPTPSGQIRKLRLEVLGNHTPCGGESGGSHRELTPGVGQARRRPCSLPPALLQLGRWPGALHRPRRSWRLVPAEGGLWLTLCPWVSGQPPPRAAPPAEGGGDYYQEPFIGCTLYTNRVYNPVY